MTLLLQLHPLKERERSHLTLVLLPDRLMATDRSELLGCCRGDCLCVTGYLRADYHNCLLQLLHRLPTFIVPPRKFQWSVNCRHE